MGSFNHSYRPKKPTDSATCGNNGENTSTHKERVLIQFMTKDSQCEAKNAQNGA